MYRNLALMIRDFLLSLSMQVLFSQMILFAAIPGSESQCSAIKARKVLPRRLELSDPLLALIGLLVTDKNFHFVIGLQRTY